MDPRALHDDTLALARALIACQSVTPDDGGALDLVAERLTRAGFASVSIDPLDTALSLVVRSTRP